MKTCFIVCPIGENSSPERKRSDTVLKHIIQPICEELEYEVIRVDQINDVDSIDRTILEQLEKAELVIADLTDYNPNAFYELGYRHALKKPLIPIIEEGNKIPFDLSSIRTISYVTNDLDKAEETKKKLISTITALNIQPTIEQSNKQNPTQESIIPYLLNIGDSIEDLKKIVQEKNDEMLDKVLSSALGHIQKNSATVEDKMMETILKEAFKNPEQFESFASLAAKWSKK